MLRALRSGEVDAVVGTGQQGLQVYSLEGAEHAYRVLIESMNEGALMLTAGNTILYANRCFARMVKLPLEKVMGSSFRRFLAGEDQTSLRSLLKRPGRSGAKIQLTLKIGDRSHLAVQISLRSLARNGFAQATFGMVVTDVTEVRRNEERLRALTHRVVQVQEAERGRVALELHDNITQLLCGVLFRSQALADGLSADHGPLKAGAEELREMLGQTAAEVERISRDLRPGVLDQLGLVAILRGTSSEFSDRTGIAVKLACPPWAARLPADTELALYRIFQEALKNVERHARARLVSVTLKLHRSFVQLAINDDGVGFDPDRSPDRRGRKAGLGLLGMRERATYVGGTLKIKSAPRTGTKIEARIPLPPPVAAAA